MNGVVSGGPIGFIGAITWQPEGLDYKDMNDEGTKIDDKKVLRQL